MQVQNICLKMEDIMREYEDVALQFYDDARVLQAAVENAEADQNGEKGKEDNIALIEEKLYTMSRQRKHIKNVQFVTPGRQYHMMEENGYRRGGTIRNLTEFIIRHIIRSRRKNMDIRFGLRMQDKVRRFMKTSRVCMDLEV